MSTTVKRIKIIEALNLDLKDSNTRTIIDSIIDGGKTDNTERVRNCKEIFVHL